MTAGRLHARLIDSHTIEVTGQDRPGLFSLVSGLLGACGFEIRSGEVTTTGTSPARIVDRFDVDAPRGQHSNADASFDRFSRLLSKLDEQLGASDQAARRLVAEEVAARLSAHQIAVTPGVLLPIELTIEPGDTTTRVVVTGADTPFFLYSMSTAIALLDLSIVRVAIETPDGQVRDTLEITDRRGRAVTDERTLGLLRMSVAIAKQFTFHLDSAPDPFAALDRFHLFVQNIADSPDGPALQEALLEPDYQRELARVLGTSDFLWEDFIRLQHEALLPLLRSGREHALSLDAEAMHSALNRVIDSTADDTDAIEKLNAFKDRQSYYIDLDHILHQGHDFFFLSGRLTPLAEAVVGTALRIAWRTLTRRHGEPRTSAGLPADWAVFGLGKLGGAALGYASDLELMFVFGDNGGTDGERSVSNREFFERLFRFAVSAIHTKREGIFQIDLRLRPFGEDGPIVVALDSFISYYGPGGKAHSAEILALIRLRAIAGVEDFGLRVQRIRDELVYHADAIDIRELWALRQRQLAEKAKPDRVNAKFAPGALVDLEYNVQILQIRHAQENPKLMTPSIHQALEELARVGTLDPAESQSLTDAYRFLRRLINGLRMLRGDARDLYLPAQDSAEYRYLARRIGYHGRRGMPAERQLRIEFDTYTAWVRTFVERHFGEDAIVDHSSYSVLDLALSTETDAEPADRLLADAGFEDVDRAGFNLRSIASIPHDRDSTSRLLLQAWQVLKDSIDPDMALNHWERFIHNHPSPDEHVRQLLWQPTRLSLLLRVFAGSEFLADTLVRSPEVEPWVTDAEVVASPRSCALMMRDLARSCRGGSDPDDRRRLVLRELRRLRKREMLRIATRDICLGHPVETIVAELSALATAMIRIALSWAWEATVHDTARRAAMKRRFSVLAFGKLGGRELNYSSDIDIFAIYRPEGRDRSEDEERDYTRVLKNLVHALSAYTDEGRAYRVDLRLRPYGSSGPVVTSLPSAITYYEKRADPWEHQALLKVRPVAGSETLAREFLDATKKTFFRRHNVETIRSSVVKMRALGEAHHTRGAEVDIKQGSGGIRDIEFAVQFLQLANAPHAPSLLTAGTIDGIDRLRKTGIIPAEDWHGLTDSYIFLRRVEHFLQLYADRQLHVIPADPIARRKLAAMAIGPDTTSEAFNERLQTARLAARSAYDRYVVATGVTSEGQEPNAPDRP